MKQDRPTKALAGTLLACTAVLLAFMSALLALTGEFEHWTFEDKRRADAAQGRLVAPTTAVRTEQGTQQSLWSKPADSAVNSRSVTLVDFIYTSCPTVCQTLGSEYTQMQEALELQRATYDNSIQLVSLSFDVAHDGPTQLAGYAQLHRANANFWTIAAPLTKADATTLLHALGVVVIPDGTGGFVHNGSIHVLDSTGKVLAIYDDADWKPALALALRVAKAAQ